MELPLEFIRDHRAVLGKLALGRFMILPWEQAEDHEQWCLDLITLSVELDVEVIHEPVPKKNLTVIFNGKKVPKFEAIQYGIRRIEYHRFMARDEQKLRVPGHRVTASGLVIPPP